MNQDFLSKALADQLEFQTTMVKDGSYPASSYEERTLRTKEMTLHLISEIESLLQASGAWKFHRNVPKPENREHVKIELIDMFKYWMLLCLIHGVDSQEIEDTYWNKSMVVRQRYAEEWLSTVDRPSVIVDIDNVLADYIVGFLGWAANHPTFTIAEQARLALARRPEYVNAATLRMSNGDYALLKHEFRVSHQHRYLPAMPEATLFLHGLHAAGIQIILLTARPITEYPNLQVDTVHWLNLRQMPFDFIWWAQDKGLAAIERVDRQHILFAVDDDHRHIEQYAEQGIMAFHYRPGKKEVNEELGETNSLTRILELAETYGGSHVPRFRTSPARPAHGPDTQE